MLQPCRNIAVLLPGPSTSEKGIILLMGAMQSMGSVALVCLPSDFVLQDSMLSAGESQLVVFESGIEKGLELNLLAHSNLAVSEVISGEVTQPVVSGVL